MPKKTTSSNFPGRVLTQKEKAELRRRLEAITELEKTSELLNVAGGATRLKLLYLLEQERDLPVAELAHTLGVTLPTVSQHLAKLRIYGLVTPRREAQTIYYRLSDHPFNGKLRASVFRPSLHQ